MSAALASGAEVRPEDRAAWLAERRTGIGASEAAAVVGLSPFETPLELYMRKVGLLPEPEETEAMRWGTALEPLLAAEYERRTGAKLIARQVFVRHAEHPLFATLDALREDGTPVEFKTTSAWNRGKLGEEGTDDIPDHWLVQAHMQMWLACAKSAEFAVLVGGQEFRTFRVEMADDLMERLLTRLGAFWARVAHRDPPPPTTAADARLMHALHPGTAGEPLVLDGDTVAIAERWEWCKDEIRRLEEERDRAKAELLFHLGDAPAGILPDGRRVTRRVVSVAEQVVTRKAYQFTDVRLTKAKG